MTFSPFTGLTIETITASTIATVDRHLVNLGFLLRLALDSPSDALDSLGDVVDYASLRCAAPDNSASAAAFGPCIIPYAFCSVFVVPYRLRECYTARPAPSSALPTVGPASVISPYAYPVMPPTPSAPPLVSQDRVTTLDLAVASP